MQASDLLGYSAALLVFVTFATRGMVSLRVVGLLSNIVFIAYGIAAHLPPVVLLHAALIPVNAWRLYEALNVVRPILCADAAEPIRG